MLSVSRFFIVSEASRSLPHARYIQLSLSFSQLPQQHSELSVEIFDLGSCYTAIDGPRCSVPHERTAEPANQDIERTVTDIDYFRLSSQSPGSWAHCVGKHTNLGTRNSSK